MVTIKRFHDTMTAHIARSILQEEGIDAFIADENLANADPPIVFASGGVRIQVPDEDAERAWEILKGMDDKVTGFELPDDFDVGEKPKRTPSQDSGFSFGWLIFSFALGALVMAFSMRAGDDRMFRNPIIPPDPANMPVEGDNNMDGNPDCTYFYHSGQLVSTAEDANFDGKVDTKYEYENNIPKTGSFDLDRDGLFETSITFGSSRFDFVSEVDFGLDGQVDMITEVKDEVTGKTEWFQKGKLKKIRNYGPFGVSSESVDTNNDGTLDTQRKFDAFGEITD
jgi:hypothetical protein